MDCTVLSSDTWAADVDAIQGEAISAAVGCLENLRLHDFSGRWLVIDVSAMDCPPCQDMAAGERAFIETLARELAQEDINSFEDNLRFINQRYGSTDPSV